MKVDIIDYGMGNLASVRSALCEIGAQPNVIDTPDALQNSTHVILPGVGSFAKAMDNLTAGGWVEPIRQLAAEGRISLLGICLGMHLLAEQGTEHGNTEGLGLISGQVVHFDTHPETTEKSLLIPHVGWNEIHMTQGNDPLLNGVKDSTDFYFVHSYFFDASNSDTVLARTPYGFDFPSIVRTGKIWGAQFHPEKSGPNGFTLLKNFIGMV